MMMPERPKDTVLIVVKSPTVCEHVYTKPDQSIFGLRALIGAKFEIKLDFIILVFAGKILMDAGTLDQHNIDEGSTVYLVQKKNISENGYRTAATTMLSSQRKPSRYNVPSAILMRVNLVKSLIHVLWPQMENMINEPTMLREIIFNDPRMKHIMERHPCIRHHINNDAYVRDMIQCILYPARLDELNRKRDLMLLRLESTPGGAAALHSINSAWTESLESVPVSVMHNSKKSRASSNNQLGKENRMPLPNPWTRPRKTRKQIPRLLKRLKRLNRILPIQIQIRESKSTQTEQEVEKVDAANNKLSPKRLVNGILGILNVGNPQSKTNPILGKLVRCATNGIAHLTQTIQKKSGECAKVDNTEGLDKLLTKESNNTATDLKNVFKTITPTKDHCTRLVAAFLQSLKNVKMPAADRKALKTNAGISTGYEETIKITKPNGEIVLVTKKTQGTNTVTMPRFNRNGITVIPMQLQGQPLLQNIGQNRAAAGPNANANGDADAGKDELPPEIRYRDQLDHLASLGFNNRNENLVALMESLGDVNAAAELLLQIKKEKL